MIRLICVRCGKTSAHVLVVKGRPVVQINDRRGLPGRTDEESIKWEYGTSAKPPRSGPAPAGGHIVKRRMDREVSLSKAHDPSSLALSDSYWRCPHCATDLRISDVEGVRSALLSAMANDKAVDVMTEIS